MHSEWLYDFCCLKNTETALDMLKRYDDIDILHADGAIIRLMISHEQVNLLKAALEYFENKQFPIKDKKYEEASSKLIEILEEYSDGMDYRSEMSKLISRYIDSDSDVALLKDVYEENELEALGYNNNDKYEVKASHTPALQKSINIEDFRDAAKTGNIELIMRGLDILNHDNMITVISTAVHNQRENVLNTVINIAQDNNQKAMVLRTIGDVFTECELFDKAIEYYNKSLNIHPNCFIAYSKIGAVYQLWLWHSDDLSQLEQAPPPDPKLLLKNAIENYHLALETPDILQHNELQQKIKLLLKNADENYNLALKTPDITQHNELQQKVSMDRSQLNPLINQDESANTKSLSIGEIESLISSLSDEEEDYMYAHQGHQHQVHTLGEVFAH